MSNEESRPATVPAVTVVVPVFNKERFVEATLESIRCQTFQDFELVLVEDSSTDNSRQVIRDWIEKHDLPCTLIEHVTNRGLTKGLNEALALGKGRFHSVLSGDDRWRPRFLELMVARIEELPEDTAAVYCDSAVIGEEGSVLRSSWPYRPDPPPEGRVFRQILKGNFISANAVLERTEYLRGVGGWDEEAYTEDLDMWLRLAYRYAFAFLPETLAEYRVVGGSASHQGSGRLRMGQDFLRIREKWRNTDESLDDAFEDALYKWERVEAMYAAKAPDALHCAVGTLHRRFSTRVLAMIVCMVLGLPHPAYCKIKDFARSSRRVASLLAGRR